MLLRIQSSVRRRSSVTLLIVVAAMLSLTFPVVSQAADPLKDNTSLAFAPENVAFYVTSLRLREVYDKVVGSQAFAKLNAIPAVQEGWNMAMSAWQYSQEPPISVIRQLLTAPENQQLVAMLKDAASQELFVYGSEDFGNAIVLFNEINAARTAAMMEAMSGGGDQENPLAAQVSKVLEVLNRQGDKLKIPTLVIGAKLSDTQPAVAELKRLEDLVTAALTQQPMLQSRFAREKIGSAEFLTLRLDGSLVWPMIAQQAQGVDPQQLQELAKKVTALTLVVSIGLRDNYLMVSVGDDNKHLAQLGQGPLLYDKSELAPVRKVADKPVNTVSYNSAAFMKQVGGIDNQMDQLRDMAKMFLPMAGLSPDLTQELIADTEKVTDFIKTHVPKPAAQTGFSYFTPEGLEGFTYSWSTESSMDPSKNLTLLEHLGGDPIGFWASRGKPSPQQFDVLAAVVSRSVHYIERFLEEQGDPDQQEVFATMREQLQPLVDQLAAVTRDKLVPAFADGQSALVLDAKSTSDSWVVVMPPSEEALPMLELGMVASVNDAGLVKEAFAEYFRIAQEILDKLHELSVGELKDLMPEEIPAMQLAKPQSKELADGTVYYYALPEETGLDKQVAPNAGLSSSVLAASMLPKFTARLLADTSLKGQGPLAQVNRPLAAAGNLDFARLIEAIEPWIDFGMSLNAGATDGPESPAETVGSVLEVLKCFRGLSLVVYQEDKAMVTHVQVRVADLK